MAKNSWCLALSLVVALACSSSSPGTGFGDETARPNRTGAADAGSSRPEGIGFSDGKNRGGLIVEPSNAVLFIDTATSPATRAMQVFRVIEKSATGDVDVTSKATFTLEKPELGAFNANTFESVAALSPVPPGVTSRVTVATAHGSGIASITVAALRRTSDKRDFFFVVPFNEAPSPKNDTLKFRTNIQNVDVAFVMDTTISMSSSISGLKSALSGNLLTQLQAAIPSVGMSIVSHRDEGDAPGELVSVKQVTTTDLVLAQAGVAKLKAEGGGDFAEGQVPAMWHVLTGAAVTNVPAVTPPAGTFGAVHFRAGAVPVVVLITDAVWHDPRAGVSTAMLTSAFNGASAKFVGLSKTGGGNSELQADSLSDATRSHLVPSAFVGCKPGQCCTDVAGRARAATGPGGTCRLNYQYSSGNDIGASVVGAIRAIATGSVYDVTVRPKNDPSNPNGIDATLFIKALRAKDEGDATENCPMHAAKDTDGDGINDTFVAVTVGTPVCFEVIPKMNTTVEGQAEALFPRAELDVLGLPGDIKLDTRSVLFLIPPKARVAR